MILAYLCVKLQMRLYVCQAPCPFWVHFESILGPFWVHFGSILGPFGVHFACCLNVDAFENLRVQSAFKQESVLGQESVFGQECSLDKNSSLDC